MKSFWFHFTAWMGFAASVLGLLTGLVIDSPVIAQAAPTGTPQADGTAPYVTNNYIEPVNVRAGPSSLYDAYGTLPVGATAQALGVSPKHEWIQIAFPSSPDGAGWVYAPFVDLSPGFLRVVEPPPTETPPATGTMDPTLAAAFSLQPTETRQPTFTPPPPLVVPNYPNGSDGASLGFPMGPVIGVIALVGAAVLGISFFGRR